MSCFDSSLIFRKDCLAFFLCFINFVYSWLGKHTGGRAWHANYKPASRGNVEGRSIGIRVRYALGHPTAVDVTLSGKRVTRGTKVSGLLG